MFNADFLRALRGPVLLIALGILLLLSQLNVASFGMTWPILLIVAGLMILIERSMRPAEPTAPGGQTL